MIPQLKCTEDAVAFGLAIRGDVFNMRKLVSTLKAKSKELDALLDVIEPTSKQLQCMMDLITDKQLLREAMETAAGADYIDEACKKVSKRKICS